MDSLSTGQLSPKSPHTLAVGDLQNTNDAHSSFQCRKCIEEAEAMLAHRDAISETLRHHIQKLEQLYKRVVSQSEENRLKYCTAVQELENIRRLQMISHNHEDNYNYINREVTANPCNNESIKNTSTLPLNDCEILHKNGISTVHDDQYVLIKKALSMQDLKLQFTIERRTECTRRCERPTSEGKKSSADTEKLNFLDVRDSIIRKLKVENHSLKEEISVLKEQLQQVIKGSMMRADEVQNEKTQPRSKGVSFSVMRGSETNQNGNYVMPAEMNYNAPIAGNQDLRNEFIPRVATLEERREMLVDNTEENVELKKMELNEEEKNEMVAKDSQSKKRMDETVAENGDDIKNDNEQLHAVATSIDPEIIDRIEEMYQLNRVNSKLINEIFWQLEQIEEKLEQVRSKIDCQTGNQSERKNSSCGGPTQNGKRECGVKVTYLTHAECSFCTLSDKADLLESPSGISNTTEQNETEINSQLLNNSTRRSTIESTQIGREFPAHSNIGSHQVRYSLKE